MEKPKIIDGGLFVDDRGSVSFVNDFNFSSIKRFYLVENHKVGFIRAWHAHKNESKYVLVTNGTALVGIVDLKTQEIFKYVLYDKQPKILCIPSNYANGFMNLSVETKIMFLSTSTLEESKDDDIRFPYDKWDIWDDDYR